MSLVTSLLIKPHVPLLEFHVAFILSTQLQTGNEGSQLILKMNNVFQATVIQKQIKHNLRLENEKHIQRQAEN